MKLLKTESNCIKNYGKLPHHITSVTVAQLLFLENNFQKHKILTSLEAILERFIF